MQDSKFRGFSDSGPIDLDSIIDRLHIGQEAQQLPEKYICFTRPEVERIVSQIELKARGERLEAERMQSK